MPNKLYNENSVQSIADAIRLKNDGGVGTYKIGAMGDEILKMKYSNIPKYHYNEALSVINRIKNIQDRLNNYFTFATITDNHVAVGTTYENETKLSIRHSAFAIEMINKFIGLDAFVNLGDDTWENNIDTDNSYNSVKYLNDATKSFKNDILSFVIRGNHDQSVDRTKTYNLREKDNPYDVFATTLERGYGYKDLTSKKIRMIFLNTSDYATGSTGGFDLSYEQRTFLINSLDLSSKEDMDNWKIVIFSHIPLNYPKDSSYGTITDIKSILDAYVNGGTVTITVNPTYARYENETASGTITYNYSGKNGAKIIGNFFGHIHNTYYGKMQDNDILLVASPNTCFKLEKGTTEIYDVETAYKKTLGTAQDTATTFYVVDLDGTMVYSVGYGANIDRTMNYGDAVIYSIEYNLTNASINNTSSIIEENGTYNATLTIPNEYELSTITITMGGVDVTNDVYSNNTITIEKVTGDIVITAIAKAQEWSEVVSDLAVAIRSAWYFGNTSTAPELHSGNDSASLAVTTDNGHAYTDRENNTIYLMPVNKKATKIDISTNEGVELAYRFQGLKDNGGTFAKIFDSADISANQYEWTRETVDYILVEIIRKDGSSWAWGYDDSKISVTFSNY